MTNKYEDIIGVDAAKVWNVIYAEIIAISAAWNSVKELMDTVFEAQRLNPDVYPAYLQRNGFFLEHFKGLSFVYIYSGIARLMDKEIVSGNVTNSFKAFHVLLSKQNTLYPLLGENTDAYKNQKIAYDKIEKIYKDLDIRTLRNKILSHNDRDFNGTFELQFPKVSELLAEVFQYVKVFEYNYNDCDFLNFDHDHGTGLLLKHLKEAEEYRNVKLNLLSGSQEESDIYLKIGKLTELRPNAIMFSDI